MRWEPEWIEALVRAGRRDEALAAIAEFEAVVPADQWAAHGLGRPKGMLAEDDEVAAEHFAATVAATSAAVATAPARGARRSSGVSGCGGRAGAARRVCTSSGLSSCCAASDATVLAERATTELRAAGGVVGEDVASHQLLTPHELQVARLVVGGASNRDLAAKLFISPRTVEAHLTAIFRKLAVRNRRELAARALDDPVLQP